MDEEGAKIFVQIQYWKEYNTEAFDWWNERVAILEFDAGLDVKEAEHQAYFLTLKQFGAF